MPKTVTFKFEKETTGALRFQEVDDNGEKQKQAFATIGSLYIRKTASGRSSRSGFPSPSTSKLIQEAHTSHGTGLPQH